MAKLDWDKAKRSRRPARMVVPIGKGGPPSPKQQKYIRDLSATLGLRPHHPKTRQLADIEIKRLLRIKAARQREAA